MASEQHVDRRVAKRSQLLNSLGGVKVDVFVRVRPRLRIDGSSNVVVVSADESRSEIVVESDRAAAADAFMYDRVFDDKASQSKVFEQALQPLADQLLQGVSCALFAYGQSGSGKSYSVRGTGPIGQPES